VFEPHCCADYGASQIKILIGCRTGQRNFPARPSCGRNRSKAYGGNGRQFPRFDLCRDRTAQGNRGNLWRAAGTVRSRFCDHHLNDEQARQLEYLEDVVVDAAWDLFLRASRIDLINTEPTTLAGIVAAIRYIQVQTRNDGIFHAAGYRFRIR
jgi:hypothetical protein